MPLEPFHYIITIHNKEWLLCDVLKGVAACAGKEATIIPVLDGCTDGSAEIVKAFAEKSPCAVQPVLASDVHEIRAINLGLKHCGPGFVVVLQDDIILRDTSLEVRVRELYQQHRQRIGLLSLRMGGKLGTEKPVSRLLHFLRRRGRWSARTLDAFDLVGSPFDTHPVQKSSTLAPGQFTETTVVYKSPVIVSPALRDREPFLDEQLAPYAYDDLDLSVRALRHGLKNGVFALEYVSNVDWGSTRKSDDFATNAGRIVMRNRAYLWQKHRDFLQGDGRTWLRRLP